MTAVAEHDTAAAPATSPPRWGAADAFCLALILAAAAAVRYASLGVPTFDELWHLALTKGWGSPLGAFTTDVIHRDAISQTSLESARSLAHVWTGMGGVLHPPLYVVLLRVWREVFGASEVAAQSLSIAMSLISVLLCYATARLTMNRPIACIAASALAFAQTQVYLAQEIRSYAMLVALASIGLWLMTRVEVLGPTRRRATGLAVISLLIILTHYFGAGAAAAITLHGAWRMGPHRRWFLAATAIGAIVFAASWLRFALTQLGDLSSGDALLHRPDVSTIERLALLAGVPFRLLAERDFQVELTPLFSGVLFLLPWLLVRRFRPLLPWMLWMWLSVLPVLILDLSRNTVHLALIRYVAVATPAIPLLFAGVAWPIRRPLAYACALGSLAVGAIYLVSRNQMPIDSPDVSPIARTIAARIAPGEPILSYEPRGAVWMSDVWMMTCSHEPGLFPRTVVELTKPMPPAMARDLAATSAWLICRPLERPLAEIIPGATLLEAYGGVPGVEVLHVSIAPPATSATRPSGP